MINKTEDNIERVRKELQDHREKMRMIPSEITNLNDGVRELRKFKAEKLQVDQLSQKIDILRGETIKIAGMQEELSKTNEIKTDLEACKAKVMSVSKALHDKLDKSEKDPLIMLIKDKAQTIRQNHNEFNAYKRKVDSELTKISILQEKIDGFKGKSCSLEEFMKLKESVTSLKDGNEDELQNIRTYFNSKLTLKGDKEWIRKVINKMKEAWVEFESKERDRNEAILTKKLINDGQCGSCDKKILDLIPEKTKYRDWNKVESGADKLGKRDVARSISNFGKG